MGKLIYACVRNPDMVSETKAKIQSITKRLVPDNIPDATCKIVEHNDIIYGVSNFVDTISERMGSVCMGVVSSNEADSWQDFDFRPEGSYAIFRNNDVAVEIVTDSVASRTIWYYHDDSIFIAATSQRAIIATIGKFEFDQRVLPWILSTGTLGPSFSWSRDIKRVDIDASLVLNKKSWSLSQKSNSIVFRSENLSDRQYHDNLKVKIIDSIRNLNLDFSKWVLPISGGFDSRGIACFLKEAGRSLSTLGSLTWGLKSSLHEKKSDTYIGEAVAKRLGMPHQFFETDMSNEPIEKILDRFIHCSEGRIDHLSAYADGFLIWKKLFQSRVHGIIRGDEGFGWHHVVSESNVRHSVGIVLCSDLQNLQDYEQFGFIKQEIPGHLNRMDTESLETWRDRLYHQYRIPVILAALSDIKLPYVEMINPLLSKSIIEQARVLPDHLRTEKKLFRDIVKEISPKIDFASRNSHNSSDNILKAPHVVAHLSAELSAPYMKSVFPEKFLNKIHSQLQKTEKTPSISVRIRKIAKKYIPLYLKDKFRNSVARPSINNNVLAFRIYIAGKMYKMLNEDAQSARHS